MLRSRRDSQGRGRARRSVCVSVHTHARAGEGCGWRALTVGRASPVLRHSWPWRALKDSGLFPSLTEGSGVTLGGHRHPGPAEKDGQEFGEAHRRPRGQAWKHGHGMESVAAAQGDTPVSLPATSHGPPGRVAWDHCWGSLARPGLRPLAQRVLRGSSSPSRRLRPGVLACPLGPHLTWARAL